jgi:hypothetical protein
MGNESKFQLWGTPMAIGLSDVGKEGFTTLFGGGILNPFGPTLNVVAIDGSFEYGRELPIVHISLYPFNQVVNAVGTASIQENWNPLQDLPPLFRLPMGDCPTLLLPSAYIEPDEAIEFYAMFLSGFGNGSSVYEKVRRFPGDPWSRVDEDVNKILKGFAEARKMIDAGIEPKLDYPLGKPLAAEQARELSEYLLDPINLKGELMMFLYLWDGSIKFQADFRNISLAQSAMSVDEFLEIFARLSVSCRLPDLKG